MRQYKCLNNASYQEGIYKLVPIRDEDKYAILKWRNDQLEILRQNKIISKEEQKSYFLNTVDKLFEEERPSQLLFSFLENGVLAGYGGLVHIDWESSNGEISFLTPTERANNDKLFAEDWNNYLTMLASVAEDLKFKKIFTYAYSTRHKLFEILEGRNFIKEASLREHVCINGKFEDVFIHSLFIK